MSPAKSQPQLSKTTLEFLDWLVDGVTLSVQAPDFDEQAKKISAAKKEVAASLSTAGGIPLSVQRAEAAS